MQKTLDLEDKNVSYDSVDDKRIFDLIEIVKRGIKFSKFLLLVKESPFSFNEWSLFLNLSERTLQRYKREKKSFDPIYSEKIMEVILLYRFGIEIFGDKKKFNSWLETKNVAIGGIKPKELLDNTFGIGLLKDELIRIEHGVLA